MPYGELYDLSEYIQAALPTRKSLIFLEATNTVDFIGAYTACLNGGHAVYLHGPEDKSVANHQKAYRPSFLVSTQDGLKLVETSDSPTALHPSLSLLLSTSGSTGSAKFVKLSSDAINANATSIAQCLELRPDDRAFTLLKPHYSYGMSVLNSHLAAGGSLVLSDSAVTDPDTWAEFDALGATSFAGVPYSFEVIDRLEIDLGRLKSLRYATQAGGRLSPGLVRAFAARARTQGWRFYIMYGQTEAGPRMAYMPADRIEAAPEAVGIAVPGGRLSIEADGQALVEGEVGELVYRGPNIMMGYANSAEELSFDQTPPFLATGDLGYVRDDLVYITGRSSRFIKPFGNRVSLDQVEQDVRSLGFRASAAGDDTLLAVFLEGAERQPAAGVRTALCEKYGLPAFTVSVISGSSTPRLANDKIDYEGILNQACPQRVAVETISITPQGWRPLRIVTSPKFFTEVFSQMKLTLGLRQSAWSSVSEIYETFTGRTPSPTDTLISLGADSLSYIQTSIALENQLGYLPPQWETLSITALENLRKGEA